MDSIKSEVEQLLGITEDEHNQLIFDFGYRFIENRFRYKPMLKNKWKRSKIFWDWWQNNWNQTCYDFVAKSKEHRFPSPLKAFRLKQKYTNKFPPSPVVKAIAIERI